MIVKEKIGTGFLDLRICDNLDLMAEIEDNTVDLIYCDIHYGTGKDFRDYQDLKPIQSEIEKHYIPRVKEMYRILKPTGSIYKMERKTHPSFLRGWDVSDKCS
jgi:DNA modification methylase